MEQVQANCGHASLEKTLRIVIDFYSSFTESRPELEAPLFANLGTAGEEGESGSGVAEAPSEAPAPPIPAPAAPRPALQRVDEKAVVG
jgi:hypothetical protein